ncbi:MAG: hypothetical protein IJ007_03725 [Oscillospiraceae bacterium]|nr:hypothetical protein [Oscillospiraceae bacterium]
MNKEKIKTAVFNTAGLGAVFVCTLAFLFTVLMLTSLIPKDAIRENLASTAQYYTSDKPFPMTNGIIHSARDNYADCIIFNIISSVNENDLLRSVMNSSYYMNENNNVSVGLTLSAEMDVAPNTEYSRYWHGTAAVLRPLLLVTDVKGVIVLNWAAIIALIGLNGWFFLRKNHWEAFLFLMIGMICVQVWYVPFCVCYSVPFIIMLAMSAAFVKCDEKHGEYLPALSVITGCVTCFADFLTTETITILVPLLLVLVIRQKEGRFGRLKDNVLFLVKNGAAWGISYGMMFVSKWMIAAVATGENTFTLAADAVGARESGGGVLTALLNNISALFPFKDTGNFIGIYLAAGAVIIAAVIMSAFKKRKVRCEFTAVMLMLALIPYLRFVVLNGHSAGHCFFTYRAQITTVMALAAVFRYAVTVQNSKKRKN